MNDQADDILTEGYFRWHCRRGMKELDFVFNRYLDSHFSAMNEVEKELLSELLEEQDMLLWYWLSGKSQPEGDQSHFQELVKDICAAGYLKK